MPACLVIVEYSIGPLAHQALVSAKALTGLVCHFIFTMTVGDHWKIAYSLPDCHRVSLVSFTGPGNLIPLWNPDDEESLSRLRHPVVVSLENLPVHGVAYIFEATQSLLKQWFVTVQIVLQIWYVLHHEVRGFDRLDKSYEFSIVLVTWVVYIVGFLPQAADLASAHPAEALTRWPADGYVYSLQTMLLNEGQRVQDSANVSQVTTTIKIQGVCSERQFLLLHAQTNPVAGHLETQAHAARAAE